MHKKQQLEKKPVADKVITEQINKQIQTVEIAKKVI